MAPVGGEVDVRVGPLEAGMIAAASWLWSATPIDPRTRTVTPAASAASTIRATSRSRIGAIDDERGLVARRGHAARS